MQKYDIWGFGTAAPLAPNQDAHFIPAADRIRNQRFYTNRGGNCGWVASAMVASFWHSQGKTVTPLYYFDGAEVDLDKNLPGLLQNISGGFTST